jgi:hypothetical protein
MEEGARLGVCYFKANFYLLSTVFKFHKFGQRFVEKQGSQIVVSLSDFKV